MGWILRRPGEDAMFKITGELTVIFGSEIEMEYRRKNMV
jgi:hypothetical protein